jgi:hypothetical protein
VASLTLNVSDSLVDAHVQVRETPGLVTEDRDHIKRQRCIASSHPFDEVAPAYDTDWFGIAQNRHLPDVCIAQSLRHRVKVGLRADRDNLDRHDLSHPHRLRLLTLRLSFGALCRINGAEPNKVHLRYDPDQAAVIINDWKRTDAAPGEHISSLSQCCFLINSDGG